MSTPDFHGGKFALDTGVAGTRLIFWKKYDLLSALLIWSFTTAAQYIELSDLVTLKMLCCKSVSDWSDISGANSGECLVLAKKFQLNQRHFYDIAFWHKQSQHL